MKIIIEGNERKVLTFFKQAKNTKGISAFEIEEISENEVDNELIGLLNSEIEQLKTELLELKNSKTVENLVEEPKVIEETETIEKVEVVEEKDEIEPKEDKIEIKPKAKGRPAKK